MFDASDIGWAAAKSQAVLDSGPVVFGWSDDHIRLTVLLKGSRAVHSLYAATMLARTVGCDGVAFATVGPVSDDPTVRPVEDPRAVQCAIGHGYRQDQTAIWIIPLHRDDLGRVSEGEAERIDIAISPVIEIIELGWAEPFGDVEVNSLWLRRNGCDVVLTT
jgi:hypothetical protein